MPEDLKKNQQKGKSEPKDQRKRRGRQHAAPNEKKVEKEPPAPSKVTAPEKPAYEPPPPEFYQNLKRETDEILKITEEANSKYKKKEIQSNWAKYEMPLESYEDIDEQENLGADYEALSQAPLIVGGHFQFKHEKSWDINTGPSPYDKYFQPNMDNLFIALSTIPFYERNNIDTSFFSEKDIQSMNHRAAKYKYKYYNDKKFMTPEIEVQDKLLDSLRSKDNSNSEISETTAGNNDKYEKMLNEFKDIKLEDCEEPVKIASNVSEHDKAENNTIIENKAIIEAFASTEAAISKPVDHSQQTKDLTKETKKIENLKVSTSTTTAEELKINKNTIIDDDDFEEFFLNEVVNSKSNVEGEQKIKEIPSAIKINKNTIIDDDDFEEFFLNEVVNSKSNVEGEQKIKEIPSAIKPVDSAQKEKESSKAPSPQNETSSTKNPIIESPEDLETWLDDFLDG